MALEYHISSGRDLRVVAREPRLGAGQTGARFERRCGEPEQGRGQRPAAIAPARVGRLAREQLGVTQVLAGQQVALAVAAALQGGGHSGRDVLDVDDGEAAGRVPRDRSAGDVQHRVAERVRQVAGTVDDAGVDDDDADAVAAHV